MIPQWDADGVLPPVLQIDPHRSIRSPYETCILTLVERFATSLPRCKILEDLLAYRNRLHLLGVIHGFQWIDGSFTENVELIEQRPPNDVDLVTFFDLDDNSIDNLTEEDLGLLSNPEVIKNLYNVDGYCVFLREKPDNLIQCSTYWYSMWSHRRTGQWKGFLRVDLSPCKDKEALDLLNQRIQEHSNEQE